MENPAPQQNFLGAPIKVITTFGEELEGELFCYDINGSNSVILRQPLENGNSNYRWIKTNIIREVKASGPPRFVDDASLPAVDLKEVEKRATLLEQAAFKNVKNYGIGVTEHAQEVFDAMNKTMECNWDKEDIIVFGVRITKPYTPDSCVGEQGDQNALERVKKVLQGELNKLERAKDQEA